MSNFIENAPLYIATSALIVSILTYVRAGKWRYSDEAKKLDSRITEVEKSLSSHSVQHLNLPKKEDLGRIESEIKALVNEVEKKVSSHSVQLLNLPKKEDLAKIETEIKALGKELAKSEQTNMRELSKVEAAVDRVESYLMEHMK